jgi:hypothetical protein
MPTLQLTHPVQPHIGANRQQLVPTLAPYCHNCQSKCAPTTASAQSYNKARLYIKASKQTLTPAARTLSIPSCVIHSLSGLSGVISCPTTTG